MGDHAELAAKLEVKPMTGGVLVCRLQQWDRLKRSVGTGNHGTLQDSPTWKARHVCCWSLPASPAVQQ